MNRRGFLTSMLALSAAPAVVKAESLMKLWVPSQELEIRTAIKQFEFGETFFPTQVIRNDELSLPFANRISFSEEFINALKSQIKDTNENIYFRDFNGSILLPDNRLFL